VEPAYPSTGSYPGCRSASGERISSPLDDAIGAEQRWLEGQATESDWPTLPIWPSRRRRGIRLGPAAREDDELTTRIAVPDVYIDENAIGTLVDHLADLGRGSIDEWLLNLAHYLLAWTVRANNGPPEDGEDHDREHRPDRWNAHFFYFLGFLCGAVAFERSQPLFLEPIIRLNDEAFHDALAPLLNGLDQATPLDRSGNPAQPAAVRALFAERLIRGRHWCYLAKEKSFAVEIHLGRALCAMFFHTPRMGVADPRPYLPPRCQRLPEFMPALVRVVGAAPLSGYVTDLFLGLIATYPTASLLRGLVQAASAWATAFGADPEFWLEEQFGHRICAWVDQVLSNDAKAFGDTPELRDELIRCLDFMISAGVTQAHDLEMRITRSDESPCGS